MKICHEAGITEKIFENPFRKIELILYEIAAGFFFQKLKMALNYAPK